MKKWEISLIYNIIAEHDLTSASSIFTKIKSIQYIIDSNKL